MALRYPAVVFAPNGGASFSVRLDPFKETAWFPTPMPAQSPTGGLAASWRWGGHQLDLGARVVHFTFVNRLNDEYWTADVSFDE